MYVKHVMYINEYYSLPNVWGSHGRSFMEYKVTPKMWYSFDIFHFLSYCLIIVIKHFQHPFRSFLNVSFFVQRFTAPHLGQWNIWGQVRYVVSFLNISKLLSLPAPRISVPAIVYTVHVIVKRLWQIKQRSLVSATSNTTYQKVLRKV